MQTFSGTAVAVLALAVAVTVMWRHRWKGSRFIVVMMLIAGFGITAAGWIGDMLARGGEVIGNAAGEGTSRAFGVSVPVLILVVMITWIVVDVKDRSIHPATPWIALALPTAMAVVGGVYIGLGDTVLTAIGSGLGSVSGWLGSLG